MKFKKNLYVKKLGIGCLNRIMKICEFIDQIVFSGLTSYIFKVKNVDKAYEIRIKLLRIILDIIITIPQGPKVFE